MDRIPNKTKEMKRMKSFIEFKKSLLMLEDVTIPQLNDLEKMLDRVFANVGLDVEFTKHFIERVNDGRNGKPIEISELRDIFLKAYDTYKHKFEKMPEGFEAVLNDVQTKINLPFVIDYDRRNDQFDLVSKTVMRKHNFMTSSPKLRVK